MRVVFTQPDHLPNERIVRPGDVHDFPDDVAALYIARGVAEELQGDATGPLKTTALRPRYRTTTVHPRRKKGPHHG